MQIDQRGLQVLVFEELLNPAQRHARFKQMRSHAMPERVNRYLAVRRVSVQGLQSPSEGVAR